MNPEPLPSHATYGDGFPLIKPFDLSVAGSKLEARFELPDSRDGGILRPVFVGFRFTNVGGSVNTEEKWQFWLERSKYLDEADIPIRVKLWRLEQGEERPVVMQILNYDRTVDPFRTWYAPHEVDIFFGFSGASMDTEEMALVGKPYDSRMTYPTYQISRIIPPVPGRYRIEMENLESHQLLIGTPFEAVVSHYYFRGIE